MKRNLLFHLFPMKTSEIWRWHIERLAQHKAVFTGRRIVSVVLDGRCAEEADIREALKPLEAEVHFNPNSDELCETWHFIKMLGMLESQDPQEATFYCHAKGVTRKGEELHAVKQWCQAMYDFDLGMVDVVDRMLSTHGTVGSFRIFMKHAGVLWHYSGTFYWLKHSALFSRDWRIIERSGRWGVEGYPGLQFFSNESASLTPDNILPGELYDGTALDAEIVATWKEDLLKVCS